MRKATNLIKPGKHRPAAVHEEVFKLEDSHKIFLLRRNISQLRILVYNTSHNHRKYCRKNNKKQLFQNKQTNDHFRIRERLGRCCGKLNNGAVQAHYLFFFRLVRGCGRDWVKVPPSKQFHGAAINIEPTQSQVHSRTITNGHLSTTAIFFCPGVAVVERFNCKFKISGQ